jgi:hypothetical protein
MHHVGGWSDCSPSQAVRQSIIKQRVAMCILRIWQRILIHDAVPRGTSYDCLTAVSPGGFFHHRYCELFIQNGLVANLGSIVMSRAPHLTLFGSCATWKFPSGKVCHEGQDFSLALAATVAARRRLLALSCWRTGC